MRRQRNKIVKSRADWRRADQVRRLKIVMTVITVALCLSLAAGGVLVWMQIRRPFAPPASSALPASSAPASSKSGALPVYDDAYCLTLVNAATALKEDFPVQKEEYGGVTVDGRILPALRKMMDAAQEDGSALKLTEGYVDAAEQTRRFQAAVQELMKKQGYTQVRAENGAQSTVGRAGYNEMQTGMAVLFSAEGSAADADFAATPQYRWLVKNSASYGFVLRYPENKTDATGKNFDPRHFRYVGTENAIAMREYSMSLEEYSAYKKRQAVN